MEESDSGQFGEFAKLLSRKTRVGSNPTSSAKSLPLDIFLNVFIMYIHGQARERT